MKIYLLFIIINCLLLNNTSSCVKLDLSSILEVVNNLLPHQLEWPDSQDGNLHRNLLLLCRLARKLKRPCIVRKIKKRNVQIKLMMYDDPLVPGRYKNSSNQITSIECWPKEISHKQENVLYFKNCKMNPYYLIKLPDCGIVALDSKQVSISRTILDYTTDISETVLKPSEDATFPTEKDYSDKLIMRNFSVNPLGSDEQSLIASPDFYSDEEDEEPVSLAQSQGAVVYDDLEEPKSEVLIPNINLEPNIDASNISDSGELSVKSFLLSKSQPLRRAATRLKSRKWGLLSFKNSSESSSKPKNIGSADQPESSDQSFRGTDIEHDDNKFKKLRRVQTEPIQATIEKEKSPFRKTPHLVEIPKNKKYRFPEVYDPRN